MLPDQPPLPVQEVALLVVQLSVEEPFIGTVVGLALSVTVGAGVEEATDTFTDLLALPPAVFVQLS